MADRRPARGADRTAEVTARPATPGDVEAIAVIHVAGYEEAYRELLRDEAIDARTLEMRRRVWRERLGDAAAPGFVAVAEAGGSVAGFTSGRLAHPDEAAQDGTVGIWENMYTDPVHLGTSVGLRVGLALHEAALHGLAGMGVHESVAFVAEGNDRARRFFEALGWRPDGHVRVVEGTRQHRIRRHITSPPATGRLAPVR